MTYDYEAKSYQFHPTLNNARADMIIANARYRLWPSRSARARLILTTHRVRKLLRERGWRI